MLFDTRPTDSRKHIFKRVYLLSLIITVFVLFSYLVYLNPRPSITRIFQVGTSWKSKPEEVKMKPKYLGVLDDIYVISLPTRQDRRIEMNKLAEGLGVRFQYLDAFSTQIPSLVDSIMSNVVSVRQNATHQEPPFVWPEIDEDLIHSNEYLDLWQGEPWFPSSNPVTESLPLVQCSERDFELAPDASVLPEHLILTPARVACWRSHLEVIHKIANGESEAVMVMEDDVDAERDLANQLGRLWPALPVDWDAVYLGHCWSNETFWPALPIPLSDEEHQGHLNTTLPQLHPSQAPKCNHGYIVSRTGARRILLHLRYPLFAYSRAYDQGLAWIIESGRIKSFSVYPSIVVQRKVSKSDIMTLTGAENAGWKDFLVDGFFGDNKRVTS